MSKPLNAAKTRPADGGPSFSFANRAERALWRAVWLLLGRAAPPPFGHRWRRFLLRIFGARMGKGSVVYASARIWLPRNLSMAERATLGPGAECYNIAPVTLGPGALVSQRAFLCTGSHDYEDPHFQLTARPIVLAANCWIAAEAFVGPGTEIGEGAVLAARGCAVSDLPPWTVWGGNPARQIAVRSGGDQPSVKRATD